MRFQAPLVGAITLALLSNALPSMYDDCGDHDIADPLLPESGEIVFARTSVDDDSYDFGDGNPDAAISDDWKNEVVKQHNAYRAHYGAGPLTWSDALYPGTQQWAQQCKFEHSKGNYGENLAAGTGSAYGFSNGLKSWMDEASKYDYNHPGFSSATGHFTQVVWKSSKQVACAIADCKGGTIFQQASKYIVCRYSPPGNYAGQYPQNVGKYQN